MTKAELSELIAIIKTRRDECRTPAISDFAYWQTIGASSAYDWILSLLEKYYEREQNKSSCSFPGDQVFERWAEELNKLEERNKDIWGLM